MPFNCLMPLREVSFRRLNNKMVVIVHKTVCMALYDHWNQSAEKNVPPLAQFYVIKKERA